MVEDSSKETVYGASKIAFHQKKVEALAKGEITSPIYVRLKPTNKCNHRCSYCSYDPAVGHVLSETFRRQDEIPKDKLLEIINDFKIMGVKAVTFSGGGEPLVHPNIEDALRQTLENGIDLSIITNGQRLNGERAEYLTKAKWIRVSSESCTAELFAHFRRVPGELFDELRDNIRSFAAKKDDDCELGVNFIIGARNSAFVFDSAQYFRDLGVNHIRFSPLFMPQGFFEYHAPFKERVIEQIKKAEEKLQTPQFKVFSTYERDFVFANDNARKYPRCFMMEVLPVIAADCGVYTCQDKAYSQAGKLGSIKDVPFREFWMSPELQARIKGFNIQDSCQHHCSKDIRNLSIGEMVQHLNDLKQYAPKSERHKNFV